VGSSRVAVEVRRGRRAPDHRAAKEQQRTDNDRVSSTVVILVSAEFVMLSSITASLLLALIADPVEAPAADPGSIARRTDVSLSVASGTPAVLPGLALGVAAEAQRSLPRRPLFVAARLQWTDASGANESWDIDHQQFVAAAPTAPAATVGVARLWAEVGGGAQGVRELLSRHELQRIQAADVPNGTESSFTVGPYAFGEAGVGLTLRGWFRGFVAAGPTLARTDVQGTAFWRFGAQGRVGVSYDF
jgi:hypothetical protein